MLKLSVGTGGEPRAGLASNTAPSDCLPPAVVMSLLIAFVVGVNIYLLVSFDINTLSSQVGAGAVGGGWGRGGAWGGGGGRWVRAAMMEWMAEFRSDWRAATSSQHLCVVTHVVMCVSAVVGSGPLLARILRVPAAAGLPAARQR